MGSDAKSRAEFVIRGFDGGRGHLRVAEILREAKEAASWSEEALRETVELPGVAAFVSERGGAISGIVVGRRVLDVRPKSLTSRSQKRCGAHAEGRALVRDC